MIVDDEMLARIHIRSMLNWEDLGFRICGEYSDGKQAMENIPLLKPDIVITDIKMKYVNGDELVRFIYQKYPSIKVIVLSSYDDYRYVRDTMKNQAVDYLIKNNLTQAVLMDALNKALELEKREKQIVTASESNLRILRQKFVSRLICGIYHGNKEQIRKELKELHLESETSQYVPVLVSIEEEKVCGSTREKSIIEFSVCNILEELLFEQGKGMIAPVEQNLLILLLEMDMTSEAKMQEKTTGFIKKADFCLKKFLHLKTVFYVGERASLENIDISYQKIEKRWKYCFWENEASDVEKEYNNRGNGLEKKAEEKLYEAFRISDYDKMKEILQEIFHEIICQNIPRTSCMQIFRDLIFIVHILCKKYDIPYDLVCGEEMNAVNYLEKLEKRSDCIDFLEKTYEKLWNSRITQKEDEKYSATVKKMLFYIQNHFREQVSLGKIAEDIGRNGSYLSSVFKMEMGISFTEYVNDLRLCYAKELMEEGSLKLKAIVEQAGFLSYPYFFNLFKKKYNMTPNEYMNVWGRRMS